MTQERTEQEKESIFIQWAKDAARNYGDTLLMIGAEQLEEIDRLNATIAEQNEYIRNINKACDGLDTAVYLHMCHIEHLERVIVGQASAIKEQTQKVQERDKELFGHKRWAGQITDTGKALMQMATDRAKENERLRAALEEAKEDLHGVASAGYYDLMVKEAKESAARIDKALKGAE